MERICPRANGDLHVCVSLLLPPPRDPRPSFIVLHKLCNDFFKQRGGKEAGGRRILLLFYVSDSCNVFHILLSWGIPMHQEINKSVLSIQLLCYYSYCHRAELSLFPFRFLLTNLLDISVDFLQERNDLRNSCLNYPRFDAAVDYPYHLDNIRSIPPWVPGGVNPIPPVEHDTCHARSDRWRVHYI